MFYNDFGKKTSIEVFIYFFFQAVVFRYVFFYTFFAMMVSGAVEGQFDSQSMCEIVAGSTEIY